MNIVSYAWMSPVTHVHESYRTQGTSVFETVWAYAHAVLDEFLLSYCTSARMRGARVESILRWQHHETTHLRHTLLHFLLGCFANSLVLRVACCTENPCIANAVLCPKQRAHACERREREGGRKARESKKKDKLAGEHAVHEGEIQEGRDWCM